MRWLSGSLLGLFLLPALFVLYQSFAPPEFDRLGHMAGTVLPGYLGNTVLLCALATGLALLFGLGGAFAVVFFRFPGRRLMDMALVLPLVFPPYLVAIVYREMSHRLSWSPAVDSLAGAAIILALTLYPYIYLLARLAYRQQAMGYIEIGKSLGLNRWRIATRALLPLAMPSILLGMLLVAIEVISDYGTVSVLGIHTLTTAIHRAWFVMYDSALAAQIAGLSMLLPLLLVLAYALITGGKGFVNPTNRPRPPRGSQLPGVLGWTTLTLCSLPVILGFAWPLAVLLHWAQQAFARFPLSALYGDLGQTLLIAIATACLAVLLGLLFAFSGRWSSHRGWSLGSLAVVSLNYAMPAIVLAVSLLFLSGWSYQTSVGAWLANSVLLVLLAMVMRFTAFAYFSVESGMQGISKRVDESISSVGRSRWQGVARVMLPLIRGPLIVGGLLVFVIAAKELTLSVVLQPFGFQTLPIAIYNFADIDMYEPASIYALCLVLVVIYPVLSINRWLSLR